MVMAATKNLYRVSYPDSAVALVPAASVKPLSEIKETIRISQTLYDRPDTSGARMVQLLAGSTIRKKARTKIMNWWLIRN